MPLPPSRLQFVAELIRQDVIVDTPHTAHPDLFSGSAPSYCRPAQGLDGPVLWGLGSMLHPCTKAVPRVSYRGHKGILCTYRVSPQQAETGHLLQCSEPADPGGGSSLLAVEYRLPGGI